MEDDNQKVEETEEKPEGLIDRFWWVIPPVFITFVYLPLLHINWSSLLHIMYRGHLSHNFIERISFERYIQAIKYLFIDDPISTVFWLFFLFGFMAVCMLLTRKQSLIRRIIVPIIFPILGPFIALLVFVIWLKIGSLNYPL